MIIAAFDLFQLAVHWTLLLGSPILNQQLDFDLTEGTISKTLQIQICDPYFPKA